VDSGSDLAGAVTRHARARPDAPALIWRGSTTSYRDLVSMTATAARELAGLPPGPLGIAAAKSPQTVALILGCLAAGRRVLVPAATLPPATLTGLYERAGCVVVLAPAGVAAPVPVREIPVHQGTNDPEFRPRPDEPDAVTFMLTTSGSTGIPKIVPLTAAAVAAFAGWTDAEFDLGPGRRVLNYAPLNFDLCLLEVWATLRHGGCVVLVEPDRAANGPAMIDLLDRHRPHVIQAVPLLYELLLTAARPGQRFDDVEHVVVTGDAMLPERAAGLGGLFGNARFANVYGCTETNDSFRHEFTPGDPVIPLGRPLPGVSALLIAEDGSVLTGPGTGELLVSTPFQTPGYLGAGGDDKFTEHPAGADERRYFRSGDLVRRTGDGELVLVGRTDFRVKVRGQQVDVAQVEQVLLDRDDVLEAAAFAVPDLIAGHVLHVAVRRRSGSGLNSLVLRKHCADRLPPAAIPAGLRITEDPLPRTSTGKVDRKLLAAAHIEPTRETADA
jgi:acyl-coenzyme A synthetase/AMP-(fatty) acid ligase